MNKTASIIITLGVVVALIIVFTGGSKQKVVGGDGTTQTGQSGQNIEMKDEIQYITIDAKGGYFPRVTSAKAGIPTKIIIKTNSTFDCSAYLSIRSLNFQKILPQTGETEVDLGTPKVGDTYKGVCSMGMYSFSINII